MSSAWCEPMCRAGRWRRLVLPSRSGLDTGQNVVTRRASTPLLPRYLPPHLCTRAAHPGYPGWSQVCLLQNTARDDERRVWPSFRKPSADWCHGSRDLQNTRDVSRKLASKHGRTLRRRGAKQHPFQSALVSWSVRFKERPVSKSSKRERCDIFIPHHRNGCAI